jgi:hypothetical protein
VAGGDAEEPPHPSFWRVQHGDVAPPERDADPEGRPVLRRRAIDLLGRLEASGTIDAPMRDAGRTFHALFRAAALDPLRPAPLVRLPAGTGETLTERRLGTRRKVMAALDALGGLDSAAGSCVWHVLGCGCSIREWAARQGWSGRPVGHAQAQGMLVAALGVLAAHFRLRAAGGAAQNRQA